LIFQARWKLKNKITERHLRQQLDHHNEIIEQLQKSTKTVYVAKEKPFTKLSSRPTKDKDPIISDWLEDTREHLVQCQMRNPE
jgi:glutathionylspermidine synthase